MKKIEFKFPLPRPHCGVAMGNGCLGALVWSDGNRLLLTVNRADFWDRRDGELIAEGVSYAKMRAAYDPDDPEKLRGVFHPQPAERRPGWFRSTRLPGGRFEFFLNDELVLDKAVIEYARGKLTIEVLNGRKHLRQLHLTLSPVRDLLVMEDPQKLVKSMRARPGWEWTKSELQAGGYSKPQIIDSRQECGWVQPCPDDPAMAAICIEFNGGRACSLKLGDNAGAALSAARAELADFKDRGHAVGGVAGPGCVIDHAAMGWLAQLYWLFYLYTGDKQFLRARAWPFMRGVMRTYEAMLVKKDGRFHLPLGISAEYRNRKGHSCGPNPSYQLACIHMLAQALMDAARALGETPPQIWSDIRKNLPAWSEAGPPDERRIAAPTSYNRAKKMKSCSWMEPWARQRPFMKCLLIRIPA